MTAELAELANRQWRESYRKLMSDVNGTWRAFGTVNAYLSPIPLAFANGCLVLDQATDGDLQAAVEWLNQAKVPYRVRIDSARAAPMIAACEQMGLARDPEPMPGMVMQPISTGPAQRAGVSVEKVDAHSYDEYIELMVATGIPAQWATSAFPRHLIHDLNATSFIGRLEGQPVGTSLAIKTGDLAGIFAVGTIETARRRGVGNAVTWAAVAAAREWGCRAVVLQASQMGYPVYLGMGFVPVVDYARFGPPSIR